MNRSRTQPGALSRLAALCCLAVLLCFAWLETTHAHPAGDMARGSTPCAICIAVHANAPAPAAQPLPVLFAVETMTSAFRVEGKGIIAELSLFIRPPPAA